jgi:hypothetical protein
MDSNPGGPPPLQFDTAVPQVTPSAVGTMQGVACAMCQRAIADEYFDVNGQSVCDSCRAQLAQMAKTPRGWGLFARAGIFGLGAAIAGAILYYAVIEITNFEIGIVAIAIGYMVGWAVRKGTGGLGGRRFQVLALVLTYWAVGLAYTPITFKQLAEADKKQEVEAQTTASAPAPNASEPPAEPVNIPVVVAFLLGLSLALPVLIVFGSLPGGLISGAIIAFGMQQAWRMTGVPALVISGPYRIAAASPPSAV